MMPRPPPSWVWNSPGLPPEEDPLLLLLNPESGSGSVLGEDASSPPVSSVRLLVPHATNAAATAGTASTHRMIHRARMRSSQGPSSSPWPAPVAGPASCWLYQ